MQVIIMKKSSVKYIKQQQNIRELADRLISVQVMNEDRLTAGRSAISKFLKLGQFADVSLVGANASNDLMAIGAILELRDFGRKHVCGKGRGPHHHHRPL